MIYQLSPTEAAKILAAMLDGMGCKIKGGNVFVAEPFELPNGDFRHLFCVSKGGHQGLAMVAVSQGISVVKDALKIVFGNAAGGIGGDMVQVLSLSGGLVHDAGEHGGSIGGQRTGFKDGFVLNARDIEKQSGARNLMHVLYYQQHVNYFGTIDTSAGQKCLLWGRSDGTDWNTFVTGIMSAKTIGFDANASGTYYRGKSQFVLRIRGGLIKPYTI